MAAERRLRRPARPGLPFAALHAPQTGLPVGLLRRLPLALLLVLACAHPGPPPVVNPSLLEAAQSGDALVLSDALEVLIENGTATTADREFAYGRVSAQGAESDTVEYTFARAAITGRLVQQRGLMGARQIPEVEKWALRSRELDPGFRDGAATRLLGTLYVIAPGSLVDHGDSETGLELLEGLVAEHPEVPENHLRLAEAYIALGDPDPAGPSLCFAVAHREKLRRDDQDLLDRLVATTGAPDCNEWK